MEPRVNNPTKSNLQTWIANTNHVYIGHKTTLNRFCKCLGTIDGHALHNTQDSLEAYRTHLHTGSMDEEIRHLSRMTIGCLSDTCHCNVVVERWKQIHDCTTNIIPLSQASYDAVNDPIICTSQARESLYAYTTHSGRLILTNNENDINNESTLISATREYSYTGCKELHDMYLDAIEQAFKSKAPEPPSLNRLSRYITSAFEEYMAMSESCKSRE